MAKVYPNDVDTNPNQNHQDVNEETGRHKFTRNDTTVSVDSSIIREQNKEAGHTSSQGFITMLDSQGNIKEVAEDLDVDAFVTTSAFFGRPLGSFVEDNKNR
ncbi:uncharacterized protein LOC111695939 [Eurytemora carolleeae]|uniref:uncharacterized protein LOC111695939 n=1 Tax=Eurytemora carolleeae TaxID=1294199 RepID=UPI000C78CDAA|nr:uncharacterized protein LOC111695939 [Eurytemora carolleeae]|eukprot:XP_023321185.1 uncharacterized protein LOC111695939 [Eurytemora affinis]